MKLENCLKSAREGLCLHVQLVRKSCRVMLVEVAIILRVDSVKIGERVWVMSKIQKAVLELYLRKKFYAWQITAAFFEKNSH